MKRIFAFLLLFIFCINLCACTENDSTSKSTIEYPLKEVNVVYDKNGNVIKQTLYNELTGDFTTTIFTYEYKNGFWTCLRQNTVISKNDKTAPVETDMVNLYYIQDLVDGPIVLIDNSEIKISIVEYLDKASWWEFGYKLKIENKSDKNITYIIDNVSIMEINCDPLFNVDYVEAGHIAYINVAWDRETLERCYIPYIDNVKFIIKIYDNEDWTTPAIYGTTALIKHEN